MRVGLFVLAVILLVLLAYNGKLIRRVRLKPVRVGTYYYPWWNISFNNHWDEEYKGTPFLGEYNSNDSTIADKHILWAKQHKIKFFAVSWLGEGTWVDSAPTPDGTWDFDEIDHNLRNGLLKAPHMQSFNFCLFYETVIILNHTNENNKNFTEIFIDDIVYAAQQYFSHQNYLRVESHPVLFIYNLPYLYENLRGNMHPINPKELFDLVRQRLGSMNVSLYLVGDLGGGPSPFDVNSTQLYSMNATTSYLFSDVSKELWSKVLEDARVHYPDWLSEMNLKGIDFIPNAYPGFNNTGLKDVDDPKVLPPNEIMFKEFLTIATNHTDNDLNMIMITSWNEWLEATAIEPSLELGELYLHTIYDVIPEFPSLIIPLLFMTATLLAVTTCKNKLKNRHKKTQ